MAPASKKYAFAELPHDHFRLVTVLPGHASEALQCSLDVYALTDHPQYEALSYAWGSTESLDADVSINESRLHITNELHKALLALRDAETSRTLWIDAICIDQKNISERNAQVAIMTKIYKAATRVIVWLGEESEDSGIAFDFLREMGTYKKGVLRGSWINSERQGSDTSSECGNGGVEDRRWDADDDEARSEHSNSSGQGEDPERASITLSDQDQDRSEEARADSSPMINSDAESVTGRDGGPFPIDDSTMRNEQPEDGPDADTDTSRTFQPPRDEERERRLDAFDKEFYLNRQRQGHIETAYPQLYYMFGGPYEQFFEDAQQAKWEALDNLLARSWWSRTWVVQEVWHSSDCIIQCGQRTLKWKTFEKAMDYQEGWDDMGYFVQQTARWKDWPLLKQRYGLAIHLAKKRLLGARFSDILWNTWDRKASDPRDKVFAALSLVDQGDVESIPHADYSKTMQQCYKEVAHHIINHDRKLDILLASNGVARRDGLPSWVPDWRSEANSEQPALFVNGAKMRILTYFSGSTDMVVLNGHGYSASGDSDVWAGFSDDLNELRVHGLKLGVVARIGQACGTDEPVPGIVDDAASVVKAAGLPDVPETELRTVLRAGAWTEDEHYDPMPGRKEEQVIQNIMNKRRFFVMDHGQSCIGPAAVDVGDLVFIFAGGNFPMVVRPEGDGIFALVGEAYGTLLPVGLPVPNH